MKVRMQVNIKGVVQGVNFRYFTKENADRLGLTGWVRNLPDGSVEACFEGEEPAVTAMVEWCHSGSPYGRVDEVRLTEHTYLGEFVDFTIRH